MSRPTAARLAAKRAKAERRAAKRRGRQPSAGWPITIPITTVPPVLISWAAARDAKTLY